jgi:hypothetical protein
VIFLLSVSNFAGWRVKNKEHRRKNWLLSDLPPSNACGVGILAALLSSAGGLPAGPTLMSATVAISGSRGFRGLRGRGGV